MNYVQHTRAAHERLRAQAGATPHHVSLYWALFFQWNAARFPTALDLDHAVTMQAARIGSRHTYRATLRDLDAWNLLSYHPSQSRYDHSRCLLRDLSGPDMVPPSPAASGPEVAPMPPRTEATSGPHKTAASEPEVAQALRSEVVLMKGPCGPEVAQDTIVSKTIVLNSVVVNGDAATAKKKKGPAALPDEGLSEAEVFNPDLPADDPGAAPKKKVAPKKKGVRVDTIRAAASTGPNEPLRRAPLPEVLFRQSALYEFEAFTAAFTGTDYALADLRHYHQLIDNWRDKKTGLPPLRRDWVATSKKFMLNDAADNRLKLAPGTHQHPPGQHSPNPGTRPASTGYRSKYDA
ncbi:hypothetical protein ACFP2F_11840 [Hymenobacter artigasi]|uniref:Transcriptional regulator n=1 Tax=Hymenobacter artigasi TaxID=2719616 RepID=A0ABX1HKC2_9BACT|nr:hypothetical protein [Hymenobacter artigasi]NKI89482.1 hypothetical protein [Hymenobacter artigasi]